MFYAHFFPMLLTECGGLKKKLWFWTKITWVDSLRKVQKEMGEKEWNWIHGEIGSTRIERIPTADSTNDSIPKDWNAAVFSYSAAVKGRLD